ncbi:MAG TPA: helicase-related protein, partial [bacterium]
DELWDEAESYDLASIYEARFQAYPPYLIYLKFLWERYRHELEEQKEDEGALKLTEFQKDGVWRAERILRKYHGCLIADGVGLGKTFIGGELIRKRIEEQRQKVLLIAPAVLRDGTWAKFQSKYLHFLFETVSFEQFAKDSRLEGNGGNVLKSDPREYSMVVIDEGHAFRNPEAMRSRALKKFLQGNPPKDLVLLSATPVNNSLMDLYYMIMFFARQDAAFAHDGITSLKGRFQTAMKLDPEELSPDVLFDILDLCTVRRTRNFVKKWYKDATVPSPEGPVPIRFPKPELRTIDYRFEDILPELFDRLEETIAPPEGIDPQVTMARYTPDWYKIEPGENLIQQLALSGLIRSGLLKRFESSIYSFRKTLGRMIEAHEKFLDLLDKGYVATAELLSDYDPVEWDTEEFDELIRKYDSTQPATIFRKEDLKRDVENDLRIFKELSDMASLIDDSTDPKLEALTEYLIKIAEQAEREGRYFEEKRDFRKVVIFSTFEDTVDWVEEYLVKAISENPKLQIYAGRIASTSGRDSRNSVSQQDALYGFVPESSEAPDNKREDRFDILISTDVLSEGQNLQQARHLINYDLPWNPMRLVQRHGRLDRIGSKHDKVFAACFFPESRLDDILELEGRIRRKVSQAAASVGVESEVIPGSARAEVNFAETKEEIEKLLQNNPELLENAGEKKHVHSGEDYRRELVKAMETWGKRIKELPYAVGSGIRHHSRSGVAFCAKVGERVFYRFVPDDGSKVESDVLQCLSIIDCNEDTPLSMPDGARDSVYPLWERAREDIYLEWTRLTDPRNLQPKVSKLFQTAADHLRKYPPSEVSLTELDRAVESLQAPWDSRTENVFRQIMKEELPGVELSRRIIQAVDEQGLHPLETPDPLPVISKEYVELVCWMMVRSPSSQIK